MRGANGKLDVPSVSWFMPLITPSASTLLIALNIWYFNSRVVMTCFNLVIFFFAYFYAMRPHRLWHISRGPNTGLAGWFFGSVIFSLLIYFTVLLPSILLRLWSRGYSDCQHAVLKTASASFPLYRIAFHSGAKKHLSDTECTTFRS
jgi:hypothetical protein